MKPLLTLTVFFISSTAFAQDSIQKKNAFRFGAYVEPYYSHDFKTPGPGNRQYLYNFNRQGKLNVNLGMVRLGFQKPSFRANLALAGGSYMDVNYRGEPNYLRGIFEANLGFKLGRVWIDAGVLPSHLGFETPIGKDDWTLTRSLVAEYSPYFETGIRAGYTSRDEKWYLALLALNGWQRIAGPFRQAPAFGAQVQYKPNASLILNYSNFAGRPFNSAPFRFYHNLFAQYKLTNKLGVIVGFDFGMDDQGTGDTTNKYWYTPVLIVQQQFTSRFSASLRGEYFSDPNGAVINTYIQHPFKTAGFSLNLDYRIWNRIMARLGGRTFRAANAIYTGDGVMHRSNHAITFSIAAWF